MQESDGVPPSNVDAERELLGSLLAYFTPEAFEAVRAIVRDDDFYSRRHQIVWRGISAVAGQGGHADMTTVGYFLAGRSDSAKRSYLDLCGGSAMLATLVSYSVVHGVGDRARIIAKDAEWRRRLVMHRGAAEACLLRDERAYEAAVGGERRLRVIEGGEAATA